MGVHEFWGVASNRRKIVKCKPLVWNWSKIEQHKHHLRKPDVEIADHLPPLSSSAFDSARIVWFYLSSPRFCSQLRWWVTIVGEHFLWNPVFSLKPSVHEGDMESYVCGERFTGGWVIGWQKPPVDDGSFVKVKGVSEDLGCIRGWVFRSGQMIRV
jgi:hypothetical protein